ncbi:MmpS family transport accessory protein [Mycobacterium sp. DL592]|uniref:MmpS family transport accessory protein n=1 Tax=Mycobacterium sp. DL592 TaxID=2675524 RepID=UPI00141DF9E1|nr:MmpS family transport accessory protein [Mycobacterium sp. DL592]
MTSTTRRLPNNRTRVAMAATVICGAALVAAPNAGADGNVVVYTVTSDGTLSNVTYLDGDGNRQQLNNVSAPWTTTFVGQQVNPTYGVTARSTGSQVSCTITVNGQVIDRDSDNDGTADVDCHEGFGDD